jgi:hypothetical protein
LKKSSCIASWAKTLGNFNRTTPIGSILDKLREIALEDEDLLNFLGSCKHPAVESFHDSLLESLTSPQSSMAGSNPPAPGFELSADDTHAEEQGRSSLSVAASSAAESVAVGFDGGESRTPGGVDPTQGASSGGPVITSSYPGIAGEDPSLPSLVSSVGAAVPTSDLSLGETNPNEQSSLNAVGSAASEPAAADFDTSGPGTPSRSSGADLIQATSFVAPVITDGNENGVLSDGGIPQVEVAGQDTSISSFINSVLTTPAPHNGGTQNESSSVCGDFGAHSPAGLQASDPATLAAMQGIDPALLSLTSSQGRSSPTPADSVPSDSLGIDGEF